jgi:hypothetical protein
VICYLVCGFDSVFLLLSEKTVCSRSDIILVANEPIYTKIVFWNLGMLR